MADRIASRNAQVTHRQVVVCPRFNLLTTKRGRARDGRVTNFPNWFLALPDSLIGLPSSAFGSSLAFTVLARWPNLTDNRRLLWPTGESGGRGVGCAIETSHPQASLFGCSRKVFPFSSSLTLMWRVRHWLKGFPFRKGGTKANETNQETHHARWYWHGTAITTKKSVNVLDHKFY